MNGLSLIVPLNFAPSQSYPDTGPKSICWVLAWIHKTEIATGCSGEAAVSAEGTPGQGGRKQYSLLEEMLLLVLD